MRAAISKQSYPIVKFSTAMRLALGNLVRAFSIKLFITIERLAESLSGRQDLLLGIKAFGPDYDSSPVPDKLARTDQVRPKRSAFDKCADNDADAAGSVR